MNDIENCSQLLLFVLFADDTNIFYSKKCLKTVNEVIQTEINKVSEWLNVNKLSLNITKTKFITVLLSNGPLSVAYRSSLFLCQSTLPDVGYGLFLKPHNAIGEEHTFAYTPTKHKGRPGMSWRFVDVHT